MPALENCLRDYIEQHTSRDGLLLVEDAAAIPILLGPEAGVSVVHGCVEKIGTIACAFTCAMVSLGQQRTAAPNLSDNEGCIDDVATEIVTNYLAEA